MPTSCSPQLAIFMNTNRLLIALILSLLSFPPAFAQEQKPSATGGGGRASDPSFRVVRSVSGTKILDQGGRFTVEDPRTVFYAPADKQVIVYFTWEGPRGPHRFEGLWKNPAGKVAMTSDFDYAPEQTRFSGYFKMLLGDTPAAGVWTLEARIDGETAGTHDFQITTAPRPENAVTAPTRRVLSPAEIYNRAAAASVVIENINDKAVRRIIGTGFFIGPGRLLTAFQVIDNAAKVRIVGPGGQLIETEEVIAWNRRQDWVILKVALDAAATLERAPAGSWAVGDRTYFLDVPAEGNRVIVETSLTGKQNQGAAGDRLNIADNVSRRAVGSPLLNEFGEVIGLVGGNLLPGAAFIEDIVFSARSLVMGTTRGTHAVPIDLIDQSSGSATTIAGLAGAGQFMPALVSSQSILHGTLARRVNTKANPPLTIDDKTEFSRADNQGVLFLTWMPREKRKGRPSLRMYDLDNRLISENQNKKKITVSPNQIKYSLWELDLAALPAGIYRFDVLLEGDIVWRTFFRMVE